MHLLTYGSRSKYGEKPDISANIDHCIARLKLDAMLQIALVLENLVVEKRDVVPADICCFQAVGKSRSRQSLNPGQRFHRMLP